MALQGYKSQSGFGGINYDYLSDLPKIEYGKNKVSEDSQYTGAPLSDTRGDDWGVDTSALNYLGNPFPKGMPGSPIGNPPVNQMGVPIVAGYETLPSTADEALKMMKQTVYNPGTGKFQPSTKYSYPGSKYLPERFDPIDNTLLFGSPNADVSDLLVNEYNPDSSSTPMGNILDNAANVQASILQLTHDNPTASASDIINTHHQNFTGFDSQGNFNPTNDPFASGAFGDAGYNEPTPTHTGSVFDEGGIFSSSFWKNKGGPVSGGK